MNGTRRYRPHTGTVLGMVALMVSVWGVFLKPGGAAPGQNAPGIVVSTKEQCKGETRECSFIDDGAVKAADIARNAVGSGEIKNRTVSQLDILLGGIESELIANDAVTASKLAENSVDTSKIVGGTIQSDDVGQLGLSNIDGVFPSVVAGIDFAVPQTNPSSNTNIYIGAPPGAPGNSSFRAFDTVTERGSSVWAPCETDPGSPPPYPCLEVPADGTYLVSLQGTWEASTQGERGLALNATPGPCGPGEFTGTFNSLIRQRVPASALPIVSGGDSRRVQELTGLVDLDAGQCVMAYANLYDNTSDQDLSLDVSLAMQ